ncbi:MAG: radical SAM protein [Desulfobacterales bacterium]|nr:radical SAM protein [Desulfobacterales bacterium]
MQSLTKKKKRVINRGFCQKCDQIVEVSHQDEGGRVYLVKHCPDCGDTRFPVSNDAARYHEKRRLAEYECEARRTCKLNCFDCDHGKLPSLVFIDITNRCNMNCPICLANIPAMGFRFDPPIQYFEKIFQKLTRFKPRPKIQIFGGEPTVREDLIDIIKMAKTYGISSRVVTNGIRLADEAYCKELLATKCQLMFSFDGRGREIYNVLRKNPKTLELKLKALENIRKHRKAKITIMCAAGEGINDRYMPDLLDFCHDGRDYIAALDMIPLVANWGPEEIPAGSSTMEDVERIMGEAREGIEFFPAGLLFKVKNLKETFDLTLTFGGAHPNCESVSLLISDGEKYQPLSRFLKIPQNQLLREALRLDERMGKILERSLIAKKFGKNGKKLIAGLMVLNFLRKNVNYNRVFGGDIAIKALKIAAGLIRGEKLKNLLRRYTRCQSILRMIVLPFEEKACIESARLVDCPASFAFENPRTEKICLMPVCSWPIFKNDVLRKTAEKYGTDKASTKRGRVDLNVQPIEN